MNLKLPIALSNRHVHLGQDDLNVLFGEGYKLTEMRELSQPDQYACEEKIDIVGPKNTIKGVRVLGPTRSRTQIEVSITDAFKLGIPPVIKNSGDVEGTPGAKIVGPKGQVELKDGIMVAARHIHMHTKDAEKFEVKDKDIVKIRTEGPRALVFEEVLVRVDDSFALEMHVDLEEGNAAGVKNGELVELIK